MFARFANLFGRKPAAAADRPASAATPGATTSPAAAPGQAAPCPPDLPANDMLAHIISGRTIRTVSQDGGVAAVTFADGSVMKIKTGASAPVDALVGKTVQQVRQGGVCLDLIFQDSATARVILAEQASSVLLRDGEGKFEYAD